MKKKFVRLISAVLSAAMTLTAVPLSAFAEGEEHTHDGESNVITTPLDFREKKADENGDGWSWDYDTKTLTLDGVNIQATTDSMSVVTVPDGTEIVLNGNNTIVQTDTGDSYTYVLSAVNNQEVNCDGTMTISGDGVLNAENRSTDSMARSLGGTIIINGGTVNATGKVVAESLEIHNDGALNAEASAVSNDGAAVGVKRGITVDGNGSLTAVGGAVENEYVNNGAILLNSNFGDKISVSGNGSITVPEGNAAKVGIYYDGNKSIDAEISGGKVTAYGTKCGIYKVNLIMSGTGSVYATGGTYGIGQTVPTIDEDEFVIKGSTESKASESAVTGEVKLNGGYYEIDGADAKTVVIKPDTSPRIILGKQIGRFTTHTEQTSEWDYQTFIDGSASFDITLKNISDEEFANAQAVIGNDSLYTSITKNDYGWKCTVSGDFWDEGFETTDISLYITLGETKSNTVAVKMSQGYYNGLTHMYVGCVGYGSDASVFYTNAATYIKDIYCLRCSYNSDGGTISRNWYVGDNCGYTLDTLGTVDGEKVKISETAPKGKYAVYCDTVLTREDGSEAAITNKFEFEIKECLHENGFDSYGKCKDCKAKCTHDGNIDINTGKCNKCERQFVATISTGGSAPTGYDTLADCLDSITADSGNDVKIYQDIGDTSATATLDTIDVKHNVMIDLNGHKLNNIKLGVNKDVKLTLTGTAGSYVKQVYVRNGGSFVIDSAANAEFNTIFVEADAGLAVNDGAKVTAEQLTVIASVADDGTTTTSVKLATGTKIGALSYHSQNNSRVVKLGNLLDVTRQALQRDDNGEYLDLYKEYGGMGYPYAFTVVEHTDADHKYGTGTGKCKECGKPCEHSGDINTDTGICSICGAIVSVAIYTDANGISKYVDTDELHSLLNEYNGSGTVKLFEDYSKPSAQYDLYGELTIDLNGRQFKIRSITPCKNGKLTIKNSGNPVMLGCNVYPTNDASYAGGTLIIDGDVVLDTSIYVYDSSTVILKDGTYHAGLYARDSKTLYDMLGEGKAFFKTDGTLFNASVKEISSSVTLIVKDHSHTYVDGKCDCGYICPHSDVDIDTGKCTECEYQYAAVIVKDGAVASVYKETEMEAAFKAADSEANTGCTLRVYKNYTGSYTTLSGKFTLWIAENANVGKLTVSGDITVTGLGKNNSIFGDFNVAAGGKLTFDENCGAKGTVSVGAGTFDCYYSLDITLNINDASSDVILHGGVFRKICYNGGGDRANAEILTLLAENRMFMKRYGEPIDGSKTLLKDGFATIVIVIPHEGHGYDSTTGKCTICGKRCGHTDVDSKTGVCPTCKYQLTAGISGVGTASYFGNIDDAFAAATSGENNGCTLTLYQDCELTTDVIIEKALNLNVNGKTITTSDKEIIVKLGTLTLTGGGKVDGNVTVASGTLINGINDTNDSKAVSITNLYANYIGEEPHIELYGGVYDSFTFDTYDPDVTIYGGNFGEIKSKSETSITVGSLLAKNRAFVRTLPAELIDGSAVTLYNGLTNVSVVEHEHRYNVETGKCPCGVCALAIFTETTQSSETYTFIESTTQFKNIAENEADGVLKLTGDVDCIVKGIIINGNKTIDMNGHTLNVSVGTEEISAVAVYGNVTFENSGSSRAVINATGVYSYGMVTVNGDIEFGAFATFKDGDALINAGVFKSIYVQEGRSVIEILGSGKALARESNGEILNASVQQIYKAGNNIFVKAHPKHTYDDHSNCACGYKCLHDGEGQVNEASANKVCSECGAKIYAKVTTADGKVKYFDDITEGLRYADKAENKGCVFTLVTTGGLENDITLSSGQFTITAIDDNYINAYTRKINIKGAEITVENCAFNCFVGLYSGSLTYPEGSTSVCINGISVFGGTLNISDGVSENFGANKFTISDTATDAKVTIGGGIYSEIKLGQYTFKDILASGTRLISVEYSQETDEIIATNELLYSIVSEQNTLGVDDDKDYRFVKCDHKNEDGSYAFNEGGICKYCNSEFAASVSYTAGKSEETELFSDIYDAFAKANEVGTATITLYKDIADSELTRDVNVTGNVTLALNGKKLGDSYDGKYIQSSDGGELTVNGDGKIAKTVRAKKNSKLTINSGEFDWVIIDEGGDAVISGGSIAAVNINGNAELSGGKFYIIAVYGTLESMLADGYAYKIDGGAWLSIADRARSGYSNVDHEHKPVTVEEAPIKSATITAEDESPIIYRNGRKTASFTADVTYSGNETLYVTGYLIDGTVIKGKTDLSGNRYYLFSGEVDKAVAEDGEIQYYCIFTYDGYDYKSNAVTLTVATCRHPSESVKCDDNGNYVCGICDSTLLASVELSDGTLSYYNNRNDAIGAAEDSEGCTLKLLSYSFLNYNETFDISKGRFTVDFNKDDGSGRFTFNVKGGDITFTTSQATSNPWARVQVSGENANVLIDSKARLNGLVVNSGKVTVDGANIGAITINGGDTVINSVKADSLSINKGTTDGSGYNVTIVSGTFNNFTCENGSNYTLGRAIASGSRVIGSNANGGIVYKYADIQNKTSVYDITVIKCDHKDGNGSYVLDGKPCPYCNEEIVATVSYTADGSEQTDLFSDIYDAFAKANEVGTATVTLYKDIENSEFTRYITVTGNVTLALNGKKLGYSFVSLTVEVSDGGMLTVDGDGKMMVPIIVNENAKLTVNGGEIATVMIYKDGDAVIGGGFIEDLDVNGNVKLSGGKFDNIEIANGSLESLLADGYAYKKDGGAWLSIAERAKEKYYSWNNEDKPVTVEEAPIKSATLSTKINKLYRNSNANPTLKFILALAVDPNQNDSDVRMRYGINSYECGDTVYSSLRPLLSDTKLLADKIIDKAGDSDAAEIYYVVTTGDGYEIKSNTVSIDLVDCDHSQVVDPTADKEIAGNITEPTYCEICESKFNAKITKGDDVKYYDDLDDAAKDAQKSENEGCTLYPLYNKKGYVGQFVITEGNFTLKYAVRTAFANPVVIKGNAKLKVTGRCAVTESENQDAFTVNDGDVTFDGLATGSNVTINGGNVTMSGNNINCLTINGGNVSISSGGFAEIVTTVSDKVIADYIDPGFWVQDRGTKEWIDIYSLDKATASSTYVLSVRLCPMQIIKPIDTVYYTNGYYPGGIPSLQINAEPWYSDEVNAKVAYQWIAIDENGNETVIEGATDRKLSLENLTTGRYYCRLTYSGAATAGVSMASNVVTATITECEHSGGKATCTEKAKCEICGAEYGEPLGHDYVVIKVVEPDYFNKGYSVFECTRCEDTYLGNFVPVKPIPDVEEIAVEKTTYNEVDISWKDISDVDGFNVECYVGDQWKQIDCSADGDRVVAKLSDLSAGLKYKVRIVAYAGSVIGKYRYFYVDTVPSPVWNINTVKATDETVRISWNRNTRADGYKVEWYIDNQWSVKTVTGNKNISAVIDGLCAGTRYKVRVSAYKGDLYSPYTYGYIDTLPSKVTGIRQTVTSSSFTLKWDKNESADGYTVQYYADGKWNEKTLTGNSKTTVTIGSLKGYRTYKVRIKAYKGELESAFDDIYITTAPTTVSGLKVKSAVDFKTVVIWNADTNADGYNVEYYIGGRWLEKTITDNKTATAVLGGLTPYSTYKVRVRAYKDNLYGDYSYTTVTTVLSPVTDIKVVSAKSNSITVKWGKNASADGYMVEIYKGGKWVKKTLKGSVNATVTIDGLKARSVYKVRIASYKGANTSAYTYANVNTAK